MVIGWKINFDWTNDPSGTWEKKTDVILGTDGYAIEFDSAWFKGMAFSFECYYVDLTYFNYGKVE